MTSALFVVTEEGYWGEECIAPLQALDSAGFDVTISTPTGGKPVLDEVSVNPEEVGEETAERVTEVHENDERFENAVPVAGEAADEYDVVVFPGGHGTMWDINQDEDARRLLRNSVAGDEGTALVVCHAVGLLGFARNADGEFLADGRSVTGFPNPWEAELLDEFDRLPDGRKLPYLVADEVEAAGANWDAELDAAESVTVDGDLITGRGPESSEAAAAMLLEKLAN